MKREIRELLQKQGIVSERKPQPPKGKAMSDNTPVTGFTFEQVQELMRSMIGEMNKLNPLEQKKMDQAVEKERRSRIMHVVQGHAEEQARWNKQSGCSHCADKTTGDSVMSGTGKWTTGGQVHGNDTITLVCMRCGLVWHFRASAQEREYANNVGLLGFPPPAIERCINKETFLTKPPEPLNLDELMTGKAV